jgi:hypothetical protein
VGDSRKPLPSFSAREGALLHVRLITSKVAYAFGFQEHLQELTTTTQLVYTCCVEVDVIGPVVYTEGPDSPLNDVVTKQVELPSIRSLLNTVSCHFSGQRPEEIPAPIPPPYRSPRWQLVLMQAGMRGAQRASE